MELVLGMFFVAIGWLFGWLHAHEVIALECERLGGFFVGKKVFECKLVATSESQEERN